MKNTKKDEVKPTKTDIVKLNENGGVSKEYWEMNKKIFVLEFDEGDNQ
jgi:hypothetical protein